MQARPPHQFVRTLPTSSPNAPLLQQVITAQRIAQLSALDIPYRQPYPCSHSTQRSPAATQHETVAGLHTAQRITSRHSVQHTLHTSGSQWPYQYHTLRLSLAITEPGTHTRLPRLFMILDDAAITTSRQALSGTLHRYANTVYPSMPNQ